MHWDGKLLCDLVGKQKVDRLPIIISENKEFQLLSIPKINHGTGRNTAQAVYNTLVEWGLVGKTACACFDTTAANTGQYNGAAVILQEMMQCDLLELQCRRHIHELILRSAFELKFGATSAPTVQMFQRFANCWTDIDKTKFEPGTKDEIVKASLEDYADDIINFCKEELKKKSVRRDYEELLQLCLIFMGDDGRIFTFRPPGAMSHARWMAKLIYSLKMFLFRSQKINGKPLLTNQEVKAMREFLIFAIRFYIKAWFKCTSATEAPNNDMLLLKEMYEYKAVDPKLSAAVVKTFSNHMWYLGTEKCAFALFDSNVSVAKKKAMAAAILSESEDELESCNRLPLKPSQMPWFCAQNLSDFINPNALQLFRRFDISHDFLHKDPEHWETDETFTRAKSIIDSLTVGNEPAERGVKLIEDYTGTLTKDEEQLQFLLQVVSEHRKEYPDHTKKSISHKKK